MKAKVSYLLSLQNLSVQIKILWNKRLHALCLSNISKNFAINNPEKTSLKGTVKVFSADYNTIDTNNILDIHTYLIKENNIWNY